MNRSLPPGDRGHRGLIDPIRKYFTERGIYEAIEERKAAGTWPSG